VEYLALLLVILLGVVVRVAAVGTRFVWDDEAFTYFMASRGVGHLVASLPLDAQPPLFYLLEVASLQFFGMNEAALRIPSLLCGLLLIPAAGIIAARLWSRNAGLLAAALVSLSAPLAYQSVEARSYSQLALLLLVGAWCYWQHFQFPTWRTTLLAALAGTAALYTHYFGVFVLLFAGICFLWKTRSKWGLALAPFALTAAACVPWFLLLREQQARYGAKQFEAELSLVATLVRSLIVVGTGGFTEGLVKAASAGVFLLVVGFGAWLALRKRKELNPAFPLLLGGLLYGVLHLGLALHRWPVRDAYLSIVAPPLLLLLGGVFAHLRCARVRGAVLALLLGAMATGTVAVATGRAHANPDYAHLVSRVRQANPDGVLLARPWGDLACYAFYARSEAPVGIHGVDPKAPTEEAMIVGLKLEDPIETIARGSRVCVVGKTSGAPGFIALGEKLQTAGYSLAEDETHGDVRFALWERSRSARAVSGAEAE
jgi:4-amino-4-deoxy-L-arabinose transferase-like glycosyltransferase